MKKEFYSLLTFAGILFSSGIFAQSQIFLKVDGIDGPSIDKVHAKEIEASSFSHGSSNPVSMTSGDDRLRAGKANTSGFQFTMNFHASVLELKKRLYMGQEIPFVEVTFRKSGTTGPGIEYYKIRLDKVRITSLSESAGNEIPVVSVELAAQKITWTCQQETKPGGVIEKKPPFSWDLTTNSTM